MKAITVSFWFLVCSFWFVGMMVERLSLFKPETRNQKPETRLETRAHCKRFPIKPGQHAGIDGLACA